MCCRLRKWGCSPLVKTNTVTSPDDMVTPSCMHTACKGCLFPPTYVWVGLIYVCGWGSYMPSHPCPLPPLLTGLAVVGNVVCAGSTGASCTGCTESSCEIGCDIGMQPRIKLQGQQGQNNITSDEPRGGHLNSVSTGEHHQPFA